MEWPVGYAADSDGRSASAAAVVDICWANDERFAAIQMRYISKPFGDLVALSRPHCQSIARLADRGAAVSGEVC